MSYTYSSSAELNKVTDVTSTNFDYVTGASYSPLGTLQQLNLANQVATTLGWNNLARLTSILTQKSGSAALLNLGYSYYANDQIPRRCARNEKKDKRSLVEKEIDTGARF